ncbi:uracil-DNA glycosylase [Ottowia sp.]|uniref:uracil-DNA glycosylase n=1 Tax=Ottowia sp. TaxID=1898956 RepID=UPI0025F327E4|nr:uracil-DNA glycosylase [Ottowia sp.]
MTFEGADGGAAVDLPGRWPEVLGSFGATRDYRLMLQSVVSKVALEEAGGVAVYPPACDRFRAFELTDPDDVRVVILGQDPYPTPGDAMGLSFSVRAGQTLPRSLGNIFHELADDVGCREPVNGDLTEWAVQGVLLLNTVLTVRAKSPKSHHNVGWQCVTERVIRAVAMWKRDVVFILWGNDAGQYAEMLEEMGQVVIKSSHPSPMGGSCFRGFYGSRPFTRCNKELVRMGVGEIDWTLAKK